MFTSILARLGLGLLFGRIKSAAERVPRWLWLVLGAVLLVGGAFWLHAREVRQALAVARAEGEVASDKKWSASFASMHKTALAWKGLHAGEARKVSQLIGEHHAQDLRDIAARADALRLRGPGAASACRRPGAAPGLSPAAGASGRGGAATGPGDAPVAPLPDDEPLAILPWGSLVRFAEQADADAAELKSWRSWYDAQADLWATSKRNLAAEVAALKPVFGADPGASSNPQVIVP